MSTQTQFTFPGLWPYIERAAEGQHLPFLGRGRELWHYKQVQDSLGQLPGLDAEARRGLLAHVSSVREALAAALGGIDLALQESIMAIEGDSVLTLSGQPSADPVPPGPPPRTAGSRRRRD